jgi:hypothetical protein
MIYKNSKTYEGIVQKNPFEIKEEKGKKKLVSKITLLELESPSIEIIQK